MNSINSGTIISSFVLLLMCEGIYIFMYANYLIKLNSIKKTNTENYFKSTSLYLYFYIFQIFLIPIIIISSITLFSLFLWNDNTSIKQSIIIVYPFIIAYILIYILILLKYKNSSYITFFENHLITIEQIIPYNSIKGLSHNIKRTYFTINYIDIKNSENFIKIRYNIKLKKMLLDNLKIQLKVI